MEQISEDSGSLTAHSITNKKMMDEKVEPDPFNLPHHKLKQNTETELEDLLQEYQSQFDRTKPPLEPPHWPRWQ